MSGAFNCPGCGRFASGYTYTRYNGWFNILYQVTFCKKCGEIHEGLTLFCY